MLADQPANPDAPAAGRKALLASRQNLIFSVPMLWFMVGNVALLRRGRLRQPELGQRCGPSSSSPSASPLVLELNALGVIGGTARGR